MDNYRWTLLATLAEALPEYQRLKAIRESPLFASASPTMQDHITSSLDQLGQLIDERLQELVDERIDFALRRR
jgi:hypothetical protein